MVRSVECWTSVRKRCSESTSSRVESRSSRVICSFSWSAASSATVRSRTCCSSRTVLWNFPKSDIWAPVSRSARSIKDFTTRFSRSISAWRSQQSAGATSFVSVSGIVRPPDRDAGQGLVHVDAAVLLPVGVEPDDVVIAEDAFDGLHDLAPVHLQAAQDAVEREDELRIAHPVPHVRERVGEVPEEVD